MAVKPYLWLERAQEREPQYPAKRLQTEAIAWIETQRPRILPVVPTPTLLGGVLR